MDQGRIEKIRSGVEKYKKIMRLYSTVNVVKDRDFQRLYNAFYRIRQRKQEWYKKYYRLLEALKIQNLSFFKILKKLKNQTGRIEASFVSKMFATRNPEFPIIDKWILHNLNQRLPYSYEDNRMEMIKQIYDNITEWFNNFLLSKEGEKCIKEFDTIYPGCNITEVKKIDFMLWQNR